MHRHWDSESRNAESSAKACCEVLILIASVIRRFTSSLGGQGHMSTGSHPRIGEVSPDEAWCILEEEKNARLIDVRTHAEWGFVGVPDVQEIGHSPLFIEWAQYPGMAVNPGFAIEVANAVDIETVGRMLFICRSGARSLRAAEAVTQHFERNGKSVTCLNVSEGFEGDLNATGQRGTVNGWKTRGLAWRQT